MPSLPIIPSLPSLLFSLALLDIYSSKKIPNESNLPSPRKAYASKINSISTRTCILTGFSKNPRIFAISVSTPTPCFFLVCAFPSKKKWIPLGSEASSNNTFPRKNRSEGSLTYCTICFSIYRGFVLRS